MDGSPESGESLEDLLVSEWSPETVTSACEELCSLSALGSAGAAAGVFQAAAPWHGNVLTVCLAGLCRLQALCMHML